MSFRILIADDEPLIRIDLRELLEGIGHEVIAEAVDGREALELIKVKNPDVVVLDIKMPRLNGIDVARKVADRYPVIILTAYSERHLVEQARDAGVMAYLTKPFQGASLSPAIELAVRHFVEKSALSERITRLKEELETRKLVERAKGLLMQKEHLKEEQAFRRMQKISMDKNIPIKEVAQAIITMMG
ncbi:MAG TPA: response regulator [Syntrophorhabdaceae bacterium]|jgi:response regulator NasT